MDELTEIQEDWCDWVATLPPDQQKMHDNTAPQSGQAFDAGTRRGAAQERARIRQELLESIRDLAIYCEAGEPISKSFVETAGVLAALDRTVPEED